MLVDLCKIFCLSDSTKGLSSRPVMWKVFETARLKSSDADQIEGSQIAFAPATVAWSHCCQNLFVLKAARNLEAMHL